MKHETNIETDKIHKLIGLVGTLLDNTTAKTIVIDYSNQEGKHCIEAMTREEVEKYIERVWEELL